MANNENLIPIPGRLHSVATEGHVSGANEIYDDTLAKDQATINSEVNTALGTGGTVDQRIAAALEDVAFIDDSSSSPAVVPAFDPESQTVHITAQTLSEQQKAQVRENIGLGDVDAKINEAVASEASQRAAAVSGVQNSVNAEANRAQTAEADRYTKSETYTKEEVHNLITTPNQEYVSVTATDQTTSVTDVLPATGAADTTYRVGNWDGIQYNDSVFSEYAWNGSAYIKLSTKSQVGEVYDISANHADTKYADLAAALGTNGVNVPVGVRKGGMSVKFVQSSDNKYVQYRLMAQNFSTTINEWQGVDNEPTAGSDNLVKSGGVVDLVANSHLLKSKKDFISIKGKYIKPDGDLGIGDNSSEIWCINSSEGLSKIYCNVGDISGHNNTMIAFYSGNEISSSNYISESSLLHIDGVTEYECQIPSNCKLIAVYNNNTIVNSSTINVFGQGIDQVYNSLSFISDNAPILNKIIRNIYLIGITKEELTFADSVKILNKKLYATQSSYLSKDGVFYDNGYTIDNNNKIWITSKLKPVVEGVAYTDGGLVTFPSSDVIIAVSNEVSIPIFKDFWEICPSAVYDGTEYTYVDKYGATITSTDASLFASYSNELKYVGARTVISSKSAYYDDEENMYTQNIINISGQYYFAPKDAELEECTKYIYQYGIEIVKNGVTTHSFIKNYYSILERDAFDINDPIVSSNAVIDFDYTILSKYCSNSETIINGNLNSSVLNCDFEIEGYDLITGDFNKNYINVAVNNDGSLIPTNNDRAIEVKISKGDIILVDVACHQSANAISIYSKKDFTAGNLLQSIPGVGYDSISSYVLSSLYNGICLIGTSKYSLSESYKKSRYKIFKKKAAKELNTPQYLVGNYSMMDANSGTVNNAGDITFSSEDFYKIIKVRKGDRLNLHACVDPLSIAIGIYSSENIIPSTLVQRVNGHGLYTTSEYDVVSSFDGWAVFCTSLAYNKNAKAESYLLHYSSLLNSNNISKYSQIREGDFQNDETTFGTVFLNGDIDYTSLYDRMIIKKIEKGDIISVDCCMGATTNAIAIYSDAALTEIIQSVAGSDLDTIHHYECIANNNGYVVISNSNYRYKKSHSISTWAIIHQPTVQDDNKVFSKKVVNKQPSVYFKQGRAFTTYAYKSVAWDNNFTMVDVDGQGTVDQIFIEGAFDTTSTPPFPYWPGFYRTNLKVTVDGNVAMYGTIYDLCGMSSEIITNEEFVNGAYDTLRVDTPLFTKGGKYSSITLRYKIPYYNHIKIELIKDPLDAPNAIIWGMVKILNKVYINYNGIEIPYGAKFHGITVKQECTKGNLIELVNTQKAGMLLGMNLAGTSNKFDWVESCMRVFYGNETTKCTIIGTGFEDYLGGAFSYNIGQYSFENFGCTFRDMTEEGHYRLAGYRNHLNDSIFFPEGGFRAAGRWGDQNSWAWDLTTTDNFAGQTGDPGNGTYIGTAFYYDWE